MNEKYLEGLNAAQLEAVLHTDGPNMIIAGAGSGKTRVLTSRVAHLLRAKGVDPHRVMALTFTNKAAKEMKSRISQMLDSDDVLSSESGSIWAGTFHSVFARILRVECDTIGYTKSFAIYDSDDSRSLIRSIVREMKLDEKLYKPNIVHHRISLAKNSLVGPLEYIEIQRRTGSDEESGRPRIGDIYLEYSKRCFRAGAMDFDDLLFNTSLLLANHPEIARKWQERFQYILVDEYQDTNHVQFDIIRRLSEVHRNLTVVGDDSQSIYSFRGASVKNMLKFLDDYPDHTLLKLEQNYRSTKTIVAVANSVISRNQDRIEKEVWTENVDGERIRIHEASSDSDEARFVAEQIRSTIAKTDARPEDFAVLYRTNAQSRAFEEAFRKTSIPYRIYGGISFYQRKEVKDLIAYLRLSVNPHDEEAMKRVINYPSRGIGDGTVEKLIIVANARQCSLWDAMSQHIFDAGFSDSPLARVSGFVTKVKSFVAMSSQPAYTLAHHVANYSGMMAELSEDKSAEGITRLENFQELLNGILEFTNQDQENPRPIADFLSEISLLTDSDRTDLSGVSLMTAHSSKGLEFRFVFVVGLDDGLFPNSLSMQSREDLEEERRLFYVALTRAEAGATLVHARARFRWGQIDYPVPSRFLLEIGENLIHRTSSDSPAPTSSRRIVPGSPPWTWQKPKHLR